MSNPNNTQDPNSTSSSTGSTEQANTSCKGKCRITSQTVATKPAKRDRKKIGAGEEVDLTVSPGIATWTATPAGLVELPLNAGTTASSTIKIKALDQAGTVTITAKIGTCECTIKLTVVLPNKLTMERRAGSNLIHHQGVPSCGFWGRSIITPDDVNFYNLCIRELDDLFNGTGAFSTDNNKYHGGSNYIVRADGEKAGDWFSIDDYIRNKGSIAFDLRDRIYSYAGAANNPAPPPAFISGELSTRSRWQWTIAPAVTRAIFDFPHFIQKGVSKANGSCTTSKGGHKETISNVNAPTTS